MRGLRNRYIVVLVWLALLACLVPRAAAAEPTVEELKARIPSAKIGERPRLCVQVAQRQLEESDRLYAASDNEKGKAALDDVVTYCERARDYAIESHKYQKQAEIAVRGMARKLTDIMHTLPQAEKAPLQEAISRLQRIRDDLLIAMFPKGAQ